MGIFICLNKTCNETDIDYTAKTQEGKNIFHLLMKRGNDELIEKFLEKFNQNFYKDLKRKILISIRSKLIRDKKFKLKRLVNFEKQNINS